MGIELYPHNEKAYQAARKMLAEKGLTAVVYPTGTGKSFIAYAKLMKMSEDEMEDVKPDLLILDEFHRESAAAVAPRCSSS